MADTQKTIENLLAAAKTAAKEDTDGCQSATLREIVDRADKLLLDLVGERADSAFAAAVLAIAASRVAYCMYGTVSPLLHAAWVAHLLDDSKGMGICPPDMVEAINKRIEEKCQPSKDPI